MEAITSVTISGKMRESSVSLRTSRSRGTTPFVPAEMAWLSAATIINARKAMIRNSPIDSASEPVKGQKWPRVETQDSFRLMRPRSTAMIGVSDRRTIT